MTMLMRRAGPDGIGGTVQKLRFLVRKDYWSFVAQYAASRVLAYTGPWTVDVNHVSDAPTDPDAMQTPSTSA